MGPKNLAGICASVPSKDLSWIDRVYMKLENMCVEVDKNPSILLQETSKYVESQMNVVGANMKKLCTELIQDLISPPILSSEGAEKKPECAVHCKCDCMDSEKHKQKDVDMIIKGGNTKAGSGDIPARGFEEGFENFVPQKQEGDMKVEQRIVEIATQRQHEFKVDSWPWKCQESGEELNNNLGQDGADDGEELNTAIGQDKMEAFVQTHEKANYRECEEQLILSKASGTFCGPIGEEQGDSCGHFNAYRNPEGENGVMIEEKVCRSEADLALKASRPKENPCEELGSVERMIATHINNVAETTVTECELRSQEIKLHQKAVDSFRETRARRLEGVSKICTEWHSADFSTQNLLDVEIASDVKMDANDAKFMYGSIFCTKDMEAEEANEANEIGGDLRSMYSYVFSELSRSSQEEDPMVMSDFVFEEGHEDEEQSAHWFAGEDPRKALHTEFSVDKPRQTEFFVKEFDSDWELL